MNRRVTFILLPYPKSLKTWVGRGAEQQGKGGRGGAPRILRDISLPGRNSLLYSHDDLRGEILKYARTREAVQWPTERKEEKRPAG